MSKTYEECLDQLCLKKYNHYFNMSFRRSTSEIIELMKEAALLYGESIKAGCEHAYSLPKWISVKDQLPESKKDVLCLCVNEYNKKFQFVGCYTKGHEIEYYDEDYQGEYDEFEDKHGTLFLKPGWYECEESPCGESDEVWVSRNVTHWQPLLENPKE